MIAMYGAQEVETVKAIEVDESGTWKAAEIRAKTGSVGSSPAVVRAGATKASGYPKPSEVVRLEDN